MNINLGCVKKGKKILLELIFIYIYNLFFEYVKYGYINLSMLNPGI
jgi:hypothetical protein